MLGLTSKNYHEFIFMWLLWLHNLFLNLMTNYAWNNYVSLKMIKFRKLTTRVTNVETQIRKYHYEAHNSSFDILPFSWAKIWLEVTTKVAKALDQALTPRIASRPRWILPRMVVSNDWTIKKMLLDDRDSNYDGG